MGELGASLEHSGVKVALKGFEDFHIELIALVQNPELPIPENEDDTVELTRAPFELAGQRTLQGCGNGPPASRREALVAVMQCVSVVSRIFWLVSTNQLLHTLVSHPSRFFSDGRFLF